jgi:hypothetical protein
MRKLRPPAGREAVLRLKDEYGGGKEKSGQWGRSL